MNPGQVTPIDRGREYHWYIKRSPAEEMSGPQQHFSCEELGLFERMRDYSFKNGGIPNDVGFMQHAAKTWHLSRYKFLKLWPMIISHFVLEDGRYYFPGHEKSRQEQTARHEQAVYWGRIGGKKRQEAWRELEPEVDPEVPAETASEADPPPAETAGPAAGEIIPAPDPERDFKMIASRSVELGMPMPDRKQALKIRAKFPADMLIEDIVQCLTRYPNQKVPGLWLHKEFQDLVLQRGYQDAIAQNPELAKKPPAEDDQARIVAEMKKHERAKAKSHGGTG